MTRLPKLVFWTMIASVVVYVGARALIAQVPAPAKSHSQHQQVTLAQQSADGTSSSGTSVGAAELIDPVPPRGALAPLPGGLPPVAPTDPFGVSAPIVGGMDGVTAPVSIQSHPHIDAAVTKLRDAKGEEEKRSARESLRNVLAQVFADDMQARERQVREIEARLEKLRQQYQARQSVKDRIIDLQMQVLEQEAAGLGFPPTGPTRVPPSAAAMPFKLPAPAGQVAPTLRPSPRVDATTIPAPNDRPLDQLKKEAPAAVSQLQTSGHFVEAADGKLYAYAAMNLSGPSMIRVIDAATGNLVATAFVDGIVGRLQFTEEGVAMRETDGSLRLRVPIEPRTVPGLDIVEPSRTQLTPNAAVGEAASPVLLQPARTTQSSAAPHAASVSEYSELRNKYRAAKTPLLAAETQFNAIVEARRKVNADAKVEDIKTQHSDVWQAVERARSEFDEVHRLLEAKMKLLELDRKAALVALDAAGNKLDTATELRKKGVLAESQMREYRTAVEAAQVEVQRAETVFQLFESIKDASPAVDRPQSKNTNAKGARHP